MKFLFYKSSFLLCLCTIFCFAAVAQARAPVQQQQPELLSLKACGRALRVFADGTVVETRGNKITEHRISEGQLQKLRRLVALHPCTREWQRPTSFPQPSPRGEVKISTTHRSDCMMDWLSAAIGLEEIQVTIPSLDDRIGTFPVYIVCDRAKESFKKSAKRNYQRYLRTDWRSFLADVSKVVGVKSFLKGCDCWRN